MTQGSTVLAHALLANDLVDEIKIFLIPVVLGSGKKLFADGSAPHGYRLIHSRVTGNGLVVAHYARAGDVGIGDAGLENPTKAEAARQVRMRREN